MKEKAAFRIEIMNEVCILVISYSLILFTEFMPDDPALQYNIGWFVILITLLNIGINMVYMMYRTALELRLTVKQFFEKRKKVLRAKKGLNREAAETEVTIFEKSKTLNTLKFNQTSSKQSKDKSSKLIQNF